MLRHNMRKKVTIIGVCGPPQSLFKTFATAFPGMFLLDNRLVVTCIKKKEKKKKGGVLLLTVWTISGQGFGGIGRGIAVGSPAVFRC